MRKYKWIIIAMVGVLAIALSIAIAVYINASNTMGLALDEIILTREALDATATAVFGIGQ